MPESPAPAGRTATSKAFSEARKQCQAIMVGRSGSGSWSLRGTGSIYHLSAPHTVPYFQMQGQQEGIGLSGQSSEKVDSSFMQSLGSPEGAHMTTASLGDFPY